MQADGGGGSTHEMYPEVSTMLDRYLGLILHEHQTGIY